VAWALGALRSRSAIRPSRWWDPPWSRAGGRAGHLASTNERHEREARSFVRRGVLPRALGALVIVGVLALDGDDEESDVLTARGQANSGLINRIADQASPRVVFIQGQVVQEQQSPGVTI